MVYYDMKIHKMEKLLLLIPTIKPFRKNPILHESADVGCLTHYKFFFIFGTNKTLHFYFGKLVFCVCFSNMWNI